MPENKIKQKNNTIQLDYILDNSKAASVNALEFACKILEWRMLERKQLVNSFYPKRKENRRTK